MWTSRSTHSENCSCCREAQTKKAAAFLATEMSYCITWFCRASSLLTVLTEVAGVAVLLGDGVWGPYQSFPLPSTPNQGFQPSTTEGGGLKHQPSTLLGCAHRMLPTWNYSLGSDPGNKDGHISTRRNIRISIWKAYMRILMPYRLSLKSSKEKNNWC